MRRKYPISFILLCLSLLAVVISVFQVKNIKHSGVVYCEDICGDKSLIDGWEVAMESNSDDKFDMIQQIRFGTPDNITTRIKTHYYTKRAEENHFFEPYINTTWQLDELNQRLKNMTPDAGKKMLLSNEIRFLYPKIQFLTAAFPLNDLKEYPNLIIQTPTDMEINQAQEDSVYASLPPLPNIPCKTIEINDTLYFTILNTELEKEYTIDDTRKEHLKYRGFSGLYSVPSKGSYPSISAEEYYGSDTQLKKVDSHIQLSISDGATVVAGMEAVFGQKMIALAAKEGDAIILYFYDVNRNSYTGSYDVMKLSHGAQISEIIMRSDGERLYLDGTYELEGEDYKRYAFAAVLNYDIDGNMTTLLTKDIRQPDLTEALTNDPNLKIVDMLYSNQKVYCLISYPKDIAIWPHVSNYIVVLSQDKIDYIGAFWSDFSEDLTISEYNSEKAGSMSLPYRTYENIMFERYKK